MKAEPARSQWERNCPQTATLVGRRARVLSLQYAPLVHGTVRYETLSHFLDRLNILTMTEIVIIILKSWAIILRRRSHTAFAYLNAQASSARGVATATRQPDTHNMDSRSLKPLPSLTSLML